MEKPVFFRSKSENQFLLFSNGINTQYCEKTKNLLPPKTKKPSELGSISMIDRLLNA